MAQSIDVIDLWKPKQSNFNYSVCNVCRLCANISDNVVPIFDKIDEKGSIYSKLKKCLPSILVLESDIKPKQICLSCVSKLELCFSFIEMSLDSDSKFETALQNRTTQQMQIGDVLSKLDLSWLQVKQESWDETLASSEQKSTKPFQSLLFPVNATGQYQTNDGLVVNKEDANHNILQSVVVPEGVSPQDLILLVELKYKDNTTPFTIKKSEADKDELNNFQTKIMDTNGNIRVINVHDFEGKFNQSDKVSSSFIGDPNMDRNANSPSTIFKSLENDVLSGMLRLENLNGDVTSLNDALKSHNTPNYNIAMTAITSVEPGKTTQTRDFSCTICGKQFTRRNRLNAHLARHSSVRPHCCDKCDQRFITRWDLTLHLRIHSGVFSCEYCGKAFPAKGKLERHRRTHTGERPFPCERCNKAFSEKRNLENHLKTHIATDLRKASTDICLSCGCLNGVGHKCNASDSKQTDVLDIFTNNGKINDLLPAENSENGNIADVTSTVTNYVT